MSVCGGPFAQGIYRDLSAGSLLYKGHMIQTFVKSGTGVQGRYIEGTGFLSILPILLPTRESGIRRDKYLSVAIFKKDVHSDDP